MWILLKSVYRWIIGLVMLFLFLSMLLIISFFVNEKAVHRFMQRGLRALFTVLFIRVETEGAERITGNGPYIFMANHVSLFDVPLLAGFLPVPFVGIAAAHQFNWPVYGWVLRRMGHIPMNRSNALAAAKAYDIALKRLQSGNSVTLLPEGHRTITGKLGAFKRLPFHLARKAGCPLVPVGLSGLFSLKSKNSWLMPGNRVKIHIGHPLTPEEISTMSEDILRDETRNRIESLIEFQ